MTTPTPDFLGPVRQINQETTAKISAHAEGILADLLGHLSKTESEALEFEQGCQRLLAEAHQKINSLEADKRHMSGLLAQADLPDVPAVDPQEVEQLREQLAAANRRADAAAEELEDVKRQLATAAAAPAVPVEETEEFKAALEFARDDLKGRFEANIALAEQTADSANRSARNEAVQIVETVAGTSPNLTLREGAQLIKAALTGNVGAPADLPAPALAEAPLAFDTTAPAFAPQAFAPAAAEPQFNPDFSITAPVAPAVEAAPVEATAAPEFNVTFPAAESFTVAEDESPEPQPEQGPPIQSLFSPAPQQDAA